MVVSVNLNMPAHVPTRIRHAAMIIPVKITDSLADSDFFICKTSQLLNIAYIFTVTVILYYNTFPMFIQQTQPYFPMISSVLMNSYGVCW